MDEEENAKLAEEEGQLDLGYWRERALNAEAEIARLQEEMKRPIDSKTGIPVMNGVVEWFYEGCTSKMKDVEEKRQASTLSIDGLRHRRNSHRHFIVFVDMDKVKEVNDTYGHKQGDSLIRALAHAFSKKTRTDDLVVRRQAGGDEFLILFAGASSVDDVKRRLVTIRHDFEKSILDRFSVPASFSFGVSEVRPDMSKEEFDKELEAADAQMYQWKQSRGLGR